MLRTSKNDNLRLMYSVSCTVCVVYGVSVSKKRASAAYGVCVVCSVLCVVCVLCTVLLTVLASYRVAYVFGVYMLRKHERHRLHRIDGTSGFRKRGDVQLG